MLKHSIIFKQAYLSQLALLWAPGFYFVTLNYFFFKLLVVVELLHGFYKM